MKLSRISFAAAFTFLLGVSAFADEFKTSYQSKKYFGGLIGAMTSTTNNTLDKVNPNFGGNFGVEASPGSHIYFGVFASGYYFRNVGTRYGFLGSESLTSFGPEVTYRNIMDTGFYVGARAGLGYRTLSDLFLGFIPLSTGGGSYVLVAAPLAGYDFTINKTVSFGLEFSYTAIGGGTATGEWSNTKLPPDQVITTMGSVKFFF